MGAIRAVALAFCLAAAVPATAGSVDCFSPGQAGAFHGGPLRAAQPRDVTERERRDLRYLFRTLEGMWAGEGLGVACSERGGEVLRESTRYLVEAQGDLDSDGDLVVDAELYAAAEGVRRTEVLRLYLREGRLRYDQIGAAGDVEPLAVDRNRLEFLQAYRQTAASGGGLVKSVRIAVEATHTGFRFQRWITTQGRLTAYLTWNLDRM